MTRLAARLDSLLRLAYPRRDELNCVYLAINGRALTRGKVRKSKKTGLFEEIEP
jgi:hypothetical protein